MKRILSAALVILMIAALAVTSAASAYDPPDVQLPDWMETAAPRFPFTDVHRNSWYFKYVWYAADHDLMMGRSEELFEPNGKMSRAEFVTILFRIDGASAEYTEKFSDVKKNSWYAGYVGWAVNAGISLGMTDDTFEPDSPITREQVAVILGRYVLERDIYFREDQAEIDAFTDSVWESLNADNKVSLFVRYINIADGSFETRIINKNK